MNQYTFVVLFESIFVNFFDFVVQSGASYIIAFVICFYVFNLIYDLFFNHS